MRGDSVLDEIQDFSLAEQEFVFQNAAGKQALESELKDHASFTDEQSSASLLIEDQVSRSSILSRRRTNNFQLPTLELGAKKTSNFLSLDSISVGGLPQQNLSPAEGQDTPLNQAPKSFESVPQITIARRFNLSLEEENVLEDSDGEKVTELPTDEEILEKGEVEGLS